MPTPGYPETYRSRGGAYKPKTVKPKRWQWGAVLLVVATLGLTACEDPPPVAPTNIIITNVNTNNNNIGTPATVKPGDKTSDQPIDSVDISQYGETCPAGSGPATWTQGGAPIVHRGCKADITCTPKDAARVPVSVAVHGPAPDLFGLVSGPSDTKAVQESNRFNVTVSAGTTVGVIRFLCVVKGIASPEWSLPVQ